MSGAAAVSVPCQPRLSRRGFLTRVAAGAAAACAAEPAKRKKLAIITTEWRERSHAWHMAERFLHGYPVEGRWHQPPFDICGVYVDQAPTRDLSRQRAREFGFTIYPNIAEALRGGGDKMVADAVL